MDDQDSGRKALAAVLAAAFGVVGVAVFGGSLGLRTLAHTVSSAGVVAYLIMAVTFVGVVAIALICAIDLKPGPVIALAIGCVPLVLGISGVWLGIDIVQQAIQSAAPDSAHLLAKMGVGQALSARVLGTAAGAALCAGVTAGLFARGGALIWPALIALASVVAMVGMSMGSHAHSAGLQAVVAAAPESRMMLLAQAVQSAKFAQGMAWAGVGSAICLSLYFGVRTRNFIPLVAFSAVIFFDYLVMQKSVDVVTGAVESADEPPQDYLPTDFIAPISTARVRVHAGPRQVRPKGQSAAGYDDTVRLDGVFSALVGSAKNKGRAGISVAPISGLAVGPAVSIGFDVRMKGERLKAILQAATRTKVHAFDVVGVPRGSPGARAPEDWPALLAAATISPPVAFRVWLPAALHPAWTRALDIAWTGHVRPNLATEIVPRMRGIGQPYTLDASDLSGTEEARIVYLSFDESARAEEVIQAAALLTKKGHTVVLGLVPDPGRTEEPSHNLGGSSRASAQIRRVLEASLAQVRAGPTRAGGRDVEEAVGILESGMSDLRRCYRRALLVDRAITGQVVLRVDIKADGSVQSVTPESVTFDSNPVLTCFSSVIQTWKYKPSKRDSNAQYVLRLSN